MAEHKVSGGTMLLFIDPNGGTTYDTVVCLKSVGVSDSINPIDTSSWCGPGKLPGLLNISYSFDGYHIQDVDTGRISGTDLRILLRNKTRIGWKLSPESPQPGDEIQTGTGFISDLSSTYSFDNVGSFNFTLQVFGLPSTEINDYTFRLKFQNDNSNYNSLLFYLGTDIPISMEISNGYVENTVNSIPAPPFQTTAYKCFLYPDYNNLEYIDYNVIVSNPDDVLWVHSGASDFTIPDNRLKEINLSAFKNIKQIDFNCSRLSESYCNTLLQQLIDNNVYDGYCFIGEQSPAITLNSTLVSTLVSRGWTVI